MNASGIVLPLQIRSIERACPICLEDLKWAIFCPQCKGSACYQCLTEWFHNKRDCPKCRTAFNLRVEQRELYACPLDGKLVQIYCKDCLELVCDSECRRWKERHAGHQVGRLDDLREEVRIGLEMLEAKRASRGEAGEALGRIKLVLVGGSPAELVRGAAKVLEEIGKFKQMSGPSKFRLPNDKILDFGVLIRCSPTAKAQTFDTLDNHGNEWELTVHPNGFSDAQSKFVSLYLKLVRGPAGRYEYRFTIFHKQTDKPIETYYAVDDFTQGSQSLACQRLINITEAQEKAAGAGYYKIKLGIWGTDAAYGPKCAEKLRVNKKKQNNYRTFIYTVHKFTANRAANRILFSNEMYDQQDIVWRFRIDCNGHQEQGEYVSTFLELLNGAEGWFDIFIRLVHPLRTVPHIERVLTHKFTVHSNWGVPHFISQFRVLDYLHNDQLKFEFGMRPAHVEQEKDDNPCCGLHW